MKKSYNQLENDYQKLQRNHNTLVRAVEAQNKEMEKLRAENAFYKAQTGNADQFAQIQKQITTDNIAQSQEEINKMATEIIELRAIIKKLKKELRN